MQANIIQLEEGETRCAPRTNLFLSATLHFDGLCAPIRLRDLSSTGARIEGAALPQLGAVVEIRRGELHASGEIVRRDERSCGLRFAQPLALERWMPKCRARGQVVVDELLDQLRCAPAPEAPQYPSAPLFSVAGPSGDALPTRLAEELAYVSRMLQSLGDDLAGHPLVVARHSDKLQNLDISTQILGHIATILVAARPDQAVNDIGMACLRKRLLRVAL